MKEKTYKDINDIAFNTICIKMKPRQWLQTQHGDIFYKSLSFNSTHTLLPFPSRFSTTSIVRIFISPVSLQDIYFPLGPFKTSYFRFLLALLHLKIASPYCCVD